MSKYVENLKDVAFLLESVGYTASAAKTLEAAEKMARLETYIADNETKLSNYQNQVRSRFGYISFKPMRCPNKCDEGYTYSEWKIRGKAKFTCNKCGALAVES